MKSSFSQGNSNCVDVWLDEESGLVCVADTKTFNPLDPEILRFDEDEWLAFTQGAHNNEFEYRNLEKR